MKKLILGLLFTVLALVSFAQNSFDRWVPTSGTNTYTTNITSFPASYNNTKIYLKFGNGNTGNSTIAINSLAAIPIRIWDGDSWELVVSGDIPSASNAILDYDNTNGYFKAVIYENIGVGDSGVTGGQNGLTLNATDLELGGTLIRSTQIDLGVFPIEFTSTNPIAEFNITMPSASIQVINDNIFTNASNTLELHASQVVDIQADNVFTTSVSGDITNTAPGNIFNLASTGIVLTAGTGINMTASIADINIESTLGQIQLNSATGVVLNNRLDLFDTGSDPAGTVDGSIWYRTDLDTYRGKANGVVFSFGDVLSIRNINTTSPITGGGDLSTDRTIAINNAAADGTTKGAASFTATDFDAASGNISIDLINGPIAIVKGANKSGYVREIIGTGTVSVTNGSNAVLGSGTDFTNATVDGLSFWTDFWVQDSGGTWYRAAGMVVTDNTHATFTIWYTSAQIDGGYVNSSSTFPGITGSGYTWYVVKQFSDSYGIAGGTQSKANNFSFAFGGNNIATGSNGFAIGNATIASGSRSFSMGNDTRASGPRSLAGGQGATTGGSGTDRHVIAQGNQSFNFSTNSTSQTVGHGALATSSSILGGQDHNIAVGANRSVILGGNLNKITSAAVDAVIIGGSTNTFSSGVSSRSVIVGGDGIDVNSAILNTVFMPRVRIGLGTTGSIPAIASASSIIGIVTSTGELGTITVGSSLAFSSGTLSISDADKTDITTTSSGTVWSIDNAAVTFAKIQNGAGLSVLGRSANTSGVMADITAASDFNILRRSGTSIGFGSIDLSQSGVVGSSILGTANGGTGSATVPYYTLASGGTATGTNTFAMGANPFIMTTSVSTGTGATAGFQFVANSLTSGKGFDAATSSVTSGATGSHASTSTAINHTVGTNGLLTIDMSGANANASRSAVGLHVKVINTGTTNTNVGGYFEASGASTTNTAVQAVGNIQTKGYETTATYNLMLSKYNENTTQSVGLIGQNLFINAAASIARENTSVSRGQAWVMYTGYSGLPNNNIGWSVFNSGSSTLTHPFFMDQLAAITVISGGKYGWVTSTTDGRATPTSYIAHSAGAILITPTAGVLVATTGTITASTMLDIRGTGTTSATINTRFANSSNGVLASLTNDANWLFNGKHTYDFTYTAGGTTGNQTINKPFGSVNIAAAGTAVTVTNSFCTTNSQPVAWIATGDATAYVKNVVNNANGTFTINLGAATTGEVKVVFLVIN